MQQIDEKILRRFRGSSVGQVFRPGHFHDLASRTAVAVALHRLLVARKIQRVRRGLYHLPRPHPIVGQTGPNLTDAVRTLMEGSQAQWQYAGAYAANALGLSEQVPAKVVILTDGPPRRVLLEKLTLDFRRAAPRNLLGAGRRSGLVIQALRYLKGSPAMPQHVARLKRDLDPATKRELADLAEKLPAWMQPLVAEIAG